MTDRETEITAEDPPKEPARGSGFRQGVFFTGFGTLINIVSIFLETMIAVRLLSTEGYGIFVLMTAAVNFLVTVVDFGFKTTVTQFISGSNRDRQAVVVTSTLAFRLLVLAITSAIVWFARDLLRLVDPTRELVLYAAYIIVMLAVASLDELLQSVLQGFRTFQHMAIAQIVRSVSRLGLSIVFLAVLHMGLMGLVYSWVISFAISSAYQYFVLPIPKSLRWNSVRWQRSLVGEMLRFGVPLQLDRIIWFASSRIDILLLGAFAGPTAVALYNVATTIPSALNRLAQSFTAVFYPTMVSLLAEGKRKQATWMLDHSVRLCSFAGAVIALGAVVFSKEIVTLVFSEKYASSSMAFALLMMGFHMTFVVMLTGYALTAAGAPGRSLGQNTVRVATAIVLNLLLIPRLGFIGPAWAHLTSSYVANPVAVILLRKSGINLTVSHYAKQTILLWLFAALFWWAGPEVDHPALSVLLRFAIVALYMVVNIALSTVSIADLKLVLPDRVTRRLSGLRETLAHGR